MTEIPTEIFAVSRDGSDTTTHIVAEGVDCNRGLVAMRYALTDHTGWHFGGYNELLWIRRTAPVPEADPGHAIRIRMTRELDTEQNWHDED